MLDFRLHHDAWGKLVYAPAVGPEITNIEPVCAFPISDPARGISLVDAHGHEVLWIDALDDVPATTRQILEDELARRHFLPIVIRLLKIEGLTEPTTWEVETDRGITRFQLRSEEDVRRVAGSRVIIVDSHGIRYLIHDYRMLDAVSRRLLERYI